MNTSGPQIVQNTDLISENLFRLILRISILIDPLGPFQDSLGSDKILRIRNLKFYKLYFRAATFKNPSEFK